MRPAGRSNTSANPGLGNFGAVLHGQETHHKKASMHDAKGRTPNFYIAWCELPNDTIHYHSILQCWTLTWLPKFKDVLGCRIETEHCPVTWCEVIILVLVKGAQQALGGPEWLTGDGGSKLQQVLGSRDGQHPAFGLKEWHRFAWVMQHPTDITTVTVTWRCHVFLFNFFLNIVSHARCTTNQS